MNNNVIVRNCCFIVRDVEKQGRKAQARRFFFSRICFYKIILLALMRIILFMYKRL